MVCVVSRTKISDNDDLFAMVYFSALEVERLDLTHLGIMKIEGLEP